MRENYGKIYVIKNEINGKVYVGQTTQKVIDRINHHFRDARNGKNTVFCRAIRKHGRDSFSYKVIDTADTHEELNKKERYWINKLYSYVNEENSNGYNMKIGWQALPSELNHKVKLNKELIKDIYEFSKTKPIAVEDIVDKFSISKSAVNYTFSLPITKRGELAVSALGEDKYRRLCKELRDEGEKRTSEKLSRLKSGENHHAYGLKGEGNPISEPVLQIDLKTGDVLKEYPSATVAAKYMGLANSSKISAVCRGERKTSKGFGWRLK